MNRNVLLADDDAFKTSHSPSVSHIKHTVHLVFGLKKLESVI